MAMGAVTAPAGEGKFGGDDGRRKYGSWEEVEEAAKAGDRAGIPMDGPDVSIPSPHASTSPLPFRTLIPPPLMRHTLLVYHLLTP